MVAASAQAQAPLRLDPARPADALTARLAVSPEADLPLDAVLRGEGSFRAASTLYPDGADVPERYWGRVVLQSEASTPTEWTIPLALDRVDAVLVREDGRRERHRTGQRVPLTAHSVPSAQPPLIRVGLDPGETATLYLHVQHDAGGYYDEVVSRPVEAGAFREAQRRRDLLQALFQGALLALAFYNLFLFVSLRDPSYLVYVFFLVSTAAFWVTREGYVTQFLWPHSQVGYLEWSFFALVAAALSYAQFVRLFLQTRRHSPRLDRALLAVGASWHVSLGLAVLGHWSAGATLAAASGLVLLLVSCSAGIAAHRAGFYPARFYLLAASSLLVVGAGYIVVFLVHPPWMGYAGPALQVATLAEVLLLAGALSVRIHVLTVERTEAVEAQRRAETESEALREADDLKTQLIGITAHDLRSPLASIVGFAEMIEFETPDQPDLHELTDAIGRGASRLIALVEDLLVTSALDGNRLTLERQTVDLGALVEEVAAGYRPQISEKNQTLSVTRPDVTPFAFVDPERFRAILDNVVSNALKYSPRGGRIEVACSTEAGTARIAVRDSGPGLSAEDQAKLFQRFRRLSTTPTGGESSTGLGLSIARDLAVLHGGDIEVESALEEGSTFTVVVPLGGSPRETSGEMLARVA